MMIIEKLPELSLLQQSNIENSEAGYLFAIGFEDRALAIPEIIAKSERIKIAVGIHYIHPKGRNREDEIFDLFQMTDIRLETIKYSIKKAHEFEYKLKSLCKGIFKDVPEIIIDISAMSKFLILVSIVVLMQEGKRVRIGFAPAQDYAPTKDNFDKLLAKMGQQLAAFAGQPTSGVSAILRSVCLSSSRLQGQPVVAVAFTSFNEELIRHSIGTLNPHRLILINGIPPGPEMYWRANATQEIHRKLIEEYSEENQISETNGLLERSVSTLDYRETISELLKIRARYGTFARIIYFATGSKMQTVALALLKVAYSDVHIEYPTPDSYFFQEYSKGVGQLLTVALDSNCAYTLRQIVS